jgi:hypothetical protein
MLKISRDINFFLRDLEMVVEISTVPEISQDLDKSRPPSRSRRRLNSGVLRVFQECSRDLDNSCVVIFASDPPQGLGTVEAESL